MRRSDEPRDGNLLETLLLLGALGFMVAPAVKGIARRWRIRHPMARNEAAIDESLEETFPASDPPASRYFDIPDNNR
ncbi:MAG TPA: hypothetical protein VGN07_08055 [Steroidobacteraceae bacterium]|jgi:hypothetical protein